MDHSRSDRILDEWQAVAAHPRRPPMPVRRVTVRAVLPASSLLVVVLLVAAITATLLMSEPSHAPAAAPAGGPASASPGPSTSATSSPTRSADPTPPRVAPTDRSGEYADCLGTRVAAIELDRCKRVIRAALGDGAGAFDAIRIEPYEPGCIRARMCMPPFGGYGFDFLVVATDAEGRRRGWRCTDDAGTVACEAAPRADFEPLVALSVTVEGVVRQDIVLRDPEGTRWSWTASAGQAGSTILAGPWELLTHRDPCDGCPRVAGFDAGTPPPGWCSAAFQALPGARIEATITITKGAPCRIEVTGG